MDNFTGVKTDEYVTYHYLNGELHRTDGPAIEYKNGSKEWWQNDKLHRTDGPANEYVDGYKAYYISGAKGDSFKNINILSIDESGYILFEQDNRFKAGCRNFTYDEAVEHWSKRTDERAKLFTEALLNFKK